MFLKIFFISLFSRLDIIYIPFECDFGYIGQRTEAFSFCDNNTRDTSLNERSTGLRLLNIYELLVKYLKLLTLIIFIDQDLLLNF